jgi:hypothetical protein
MWLLIGLDVVTHGGSLVDENWLIGFGMAVHMLKF